MSAALPAPDPFLSLARSLAARRYGCDDKRKPKPTVRVFPKLLSWNQYGRKYVSFADFCFAVKKGREGTGRVVVSKEVSKSGSRPFASPR